MWVDDVTPGPGQISVTYPNGYTDIIDSGSEVWLPTDDYYMEKPNLKIATITFKYQDEETDDYYAYVYKSYAQSGWKVIGDESGETIYNADSYIYPEEKIVIQYNFIETTVADNFPADPTRDSFTFGGWLDKDGTSYTSYLGEDDLTLYAKWISEGPTAIDVTSNAIVLVKGQTEEIEVITTPADIENVEYTYTVADGENEIISVSDEGVITAIGAGTTTVDIAVKDDPSVNTTISVTVYNNRITSATLDVLDKDKTGEDIRIIIGAEPLTMVSDFLTNIDNDLEFVKVYDKNYDDNLHLALKTLWPQNEKGLVPKVRFLDDLDFLDCHPEMDRTDDLDCYVYINSNTIKLQDVIKFSEMIEVNQDAFEIWCSEEEGIYLYWEETVIHP